jgi:hypothetical protein
MWVWTLDGDVASSYLRNQSSHVSRRHDACRLLHAALLRANNAATSRRCIAQGGSRRRCARCTRSWLSSSSSSSSSSQSQSQSPQPSARVLGTRASASRAPIRMRRAQALPLNFPRLLGGGRPSPGGLDTHTYTAAVGVLLMRRHVSMAPRERRRECSGLERTMPGRDTS